MHCVPPMWILIKFEPLWIMNRDYMENRIYSWLFKNFHQYRTDPRPYPQSFPQSFKIPQPQLCEKGRLNSNLTFRTAMTIPVQLQRAFPWTVSYFYPESFTCLLGSFLQLFFSLFSPGHSICSICLCFYLGIVTWENSCSMQFPRIINQHHIFSPSDSRQARIKASMCVGASPIPELQPNWRVL